MSITFLFSFRCTFEGKDLHIDRTVQETGPNAINDSLLNPDQPQKETCTLLSLCLLVNARQHGMCMSFPNLL